jgi:hypothetical protein
MTQNQFNRGALSERSRDPFEKENPMLKATAAICFAAAFALLSGAALAQQGTSSSWGTVGWGQ